MSFPSGGLPPRNVAQFPPLGSCNSPRKVADYWETEGLRNAGRYLIFSRTDGGSLGEILPYKVQEVVNSAGEVQEIIRKVDGTLLVLTKTREQAEALMSGTHKIGGYDVNIQEDKKRNQCRAVVRDKDMIHWNQEELIKELSPQGVINITNIKTRKKYSPGMSKDKVEWIPTASFIVTFDFTERPEILRIGYLDLVTRDYIPDPLRCYRCQKFGHMATSCKNMALCVRCAKEEHKPEECKTGLECINCGGPHAASWRSCPIYQEEKEIRRIMVQQKVPYHVGKRIFHSFVKKGTSFAKTAAKTIGCSACKCQCWTNNGNSGENTVISQTPKVTTEEEENTIALETSVEECPKDKNPENMTAQCSEESAAFLTPLSETPLNSDIDEHEEVFSVSSIETDRKMDVDQQPETSGESSAGNFAVPKTATKRQNSGGDSGESTNGAEKDDKITTRSSRKKKRGKAQSEESKKGSSGRDRSRSKPSSIINKTPPALEPGDEVIFKSSSPSGENT